MIIQFSWRDESPEMLGEMAQTEGDFDKMAIDYITEAGKGNWGSWAGADTLASFLDKHFSLPNFR